MDLTTWLLGRTPARPLVAAVPGGTGARLAVEREIRVRGWVPALSPAEATMLVVAGAPDSATEAGVEAVWRQIPAPRARVDVADPGEVARALDRAERVLRSPEHQRDAGAETHQSGGGTHPADHDVGGRDLPGHGMGQMGEHGMGGGHGMSGHGAGGHDMTGHEMHMGGMEMPGGIGMADRAPDRDGLRLDRLTFRLGPVLAAWPEGLVLRVDLQGDVVQEATIERSPGSTAQFWETLGEIPRLAAWRLDSCARLLTLAGWDAAAITAARLRDDILAGERPSAAFARWARRVRRSRVLRWSLSGLGVLDGGDVRGRLLRWLDEAEADLRSPDRFPAHDPGPAAALPGLLTGAELASARLIIASLDPYPGGRP
ncbi:hypothetical protein [Amycolatopsis alkalitolerans]|uniref:Uncharacterized protein n=1 Tax=Amycolatopsis alkalitolerans TaxID=2547244 RepID=A0A5C4M3M5_9PSEU|nr:hypothetical protein [Amycolatopsis alkalitolerans]TNC26483.1 hypothetical protein FG385_12070 [Amycolatopsis alkalitolerans]